MLSVCDIAKSTWYDYLKRAQTPDKDAQPRKGRPFPGYSFDVYGNPVLDVTIVMLLKKYRESPEFSNGGGCKVLPHYLKREHGIIVNHKKVYRLCKLHHLLLPRNKKKRKKNTKICVNRTITQPNQLWQFDIKYGYIHGENRHFYLLAFIDVFTKDIKAYHIGLQCKAHHLKLTFQHALQQAKLIDTHQLTIRSDNGPQMTSYQFSESIDRMVDHEFIPPGCPNKNAYIESFFSIIETEFFQVQYFSNFADAYEKTVTFIEFYNTRRLHGSIFNLPPTEFKECLEKGEFQDRELQA